MLKHQHILIWAKIQKPPGSSEVEKMNDWFRDVVEAIGMKILIGPHTVYCDKVDNRGLTGICAIETSHATFHAWDEEFPGTLQLDIYTCSELNLDTVFQMIERFEPTEIEYYFLDRDADNSGVCCSTNPLNACSCSNPMVPRNLKIVEMGRIECMQPKIAIAAE